MSKKGWYLGSLCMAAAACAVALLGMALADAGSAAWPFVLAKGLAFAALAMFLCGLAACREAR
ncbi:MULTISPECIES: hypothetical protein [Chromobacterium]|uniref:hypothetical protein n=1 Tax=Chromobacterium TaxID=535 RepID=UPI000D30FD07|nr:MULTISPECIES: hypothetical protein [Chromobacterium]MCP1291425.1 hypothetical protein [Chromobacterium sp. S0633]PTU64260.1 hypothetical protein DB032_04685 [Chromobacterium sp. Panama]UJB29640.1 hypothetical protein HQN78_00230 [Chromobacterium sp. Beijing]